MIVTRLQAGQRRKVGSVPYSSKKCFSSPVVSRLALGLTQPYIQGVQGGSFVRVKRSECESDHSSPYNVEGKNEWRCNPTPSCNFITCTGATLFIPGCEYVNNDDRHGWLNDDEEKGLADTAIVDFVTGARE